MDIILTVVVFACIAVIAPSAILIYDLLREFIKDKKAAKRREELIKKWVNMKLDKPAIYLDTDAEYYKGGFTQTTYNTWASMRVVCRHFNNTSSVNRCVYPDNDNDSVNRCVQHCNYSTCPLLHVRIDNG